MKTWFRNLIFTAVATVCLALPVLTENRFNVWTWSYGHDADTLDSFYIELDSFGVSIFGGDPADAAKAIKDHNLQFDLMAQHHATSQQIFISSDNSIGLNLHRTNPFPTYTKMDPLNQDAQKGYSRGTGVGGIWTDNKTGRDVIRANAGQHSAGLVLPAFDYTNFNMMSKHLDWAENVTFEAWLRLLDVDTTGVGDAVVAQMILEDWRQAGWKYHCEDSTTDSFAVERYNDTLLIVGTSSGWDTVDVIASHSGQAVVTSCKDEAKFSGTKTLINVCYEDPDSAGRIICATPYRTRRDIRISDFDNDTANYKKFAMDCVVHGHWAIYDYKIDWKAVKTMCLDTFKVYNSTGSHYDALVTDSVG